MENETKRLLLPFVHGVNVAAIDYAVQLAQESGATLVALALITTPNPRRGARLELLQQSKDFLETVRQRASRCHVPLERYEVFTCDYLKSIEVIVGEMHCTGAILFTNGCALMNREEVKEVMKRMVCPLYMIQLPARRKAGALPLFRRHILAHQGKMEPCPDAVTATSVHPRMRMLNNVVRVIKLEGTL